MTADDFPHGEVRGYRRGCGCDDCRAANAAAEKQRRADRADSHAGQVPHGTVNGYNNYLCRCLACCEAQRVYKRRFRERQRHNRRAAS